MAGSEHKVGRLSDLPAGQMKQVEVGSLKILLARVGEEVRALGGSCPHYGAPLAEGTLTNGRILCPWHQSCFDANTGDMLEPPTLDALTRFEVRLEGDDIYVQAPPDASERRTMPMATFDPQQDRRAFVILGAGAAGVAAAEALRQANYRGRILIVSREATLPYDRPNCSKDYLGGQAQPEWMPLRPEEFYSQHHIERVTGRLAAVDVNTRTIHLSGRDPMYADAMLIATGGIPRRLTVPGSDLGNVFLLRTLADSDAIIAAAGQAKTVLVVGTSFIGMEVAASLTARGLKATVVGPSAVPFVNSLGESVGRMIQQLHEEHGTRFFLGQKVGRLLGEGGGVKAAELEDGTRIEADMVVAGLGIRPATDFIQGVALNGDGSVTVDEQLRICEGVWAAGDIARFPSIYSGWPIRIEHWRLAQQHGRTAAHNMAGGREKFSGVPFFWTRHFETSVDYAGYAPRWDREIIVGDLGKRDFMVYYARGNQVLAAAGTRSHEVNAFMELMHAGRLPNAEKLAQAAPKGLEKLVA